MWLLFNDEMGCPKLTYHLTAEPRLRCVYNAADEEENHIVAPTPTICIPSEKPAIWRIYTADDEQPRLYVPEYRLYIIREEVAPGVYRYTYCLNNPLIYTDPSGEIVHLIVGAVIGGFMNLMMNAHNIDNFWQGLGYFGIGAAAGALGAGVGAGISSAMAGTGFGAGFVGAQGAMTASASFMSGAAIGGGAGFAGGFTTGFGNALMGGQNFGQALGQGGLQGLIAGGSGALLGGISGGIQGRKEKLIFRRGISELGIDGGGAVPATDAFLSDAQRAWYPDAPMDRVNAFTVEKVPASVQARMDAVGAPASTRPLSLNGKLTGNSNVYFNKNLAFSSAKDLFYSMGHEFVHVSQFAALAGQSTSILTSSFYNMLDFHAYSYQNTLGGVRYNSFTRAEIMNWMNNYPHFNAMNWINFPWTANHLFKFPF